MEEEEGIVHLKHSRMVAVKEKSKRCIERNKNIVRVLFLVVLNGKCLRKRGNKSVGKR